ncbi:MULTISPECIES: DEAD/DEAH box helicase [Marinomonas]|uniref:DEAD-box ATP-dependent RNA helicase RhpA n=1 Tax=Marinomonas arctica TaxID=383750 RepID=A0A7H1J713_9GAMM|nr:MULTISPECIES: DEAD/DEAH box helicase [Marinomonas]MCS7485684.1 DEAD/DEAH box helicase [Marinomonas sp. BSi20414]QNT06279.1 DEAD/DEAH box helicase [Marinomonas arctica]GGN28898.1 DEAD/DEAH box helicase [Marinomonas arctica]
MGFASLGLHQDILNQVNELGYNTPTPIQRAAIPAVLIGKDVMAGAQTGTGKTAAFALPLLHRIQHNKSTNQAQCIQVLVLTPTRELAQQVHASFVKYGQNLSIRSVVAYGGASINVQLDALQQGCDVLVATPGRLLELIMKNLIDVSTLQTLVLDEADRMLDMGFIIDIQRILKNLPQTRQTLFFSATFNDDIFALSKTLLKDPQLIEVDSRNTTATQVEQRIYAVDKNRKSALLSFLIGSKNWQQVLIFTRTKQGADELASEMHKDGIATQSFHGDKSQGARERVLADFKAGKVRALIATDVAARGIDIDQLQYVVNHELPYNAEDYIHRIGRTGRAGAMGLAISLVSEAERYLLTDIEKLVGESFVPQWLPGFEPDLTKTVDAPKKRQPSKKELRAKALGLTSSKNKKAKRKH